MNEKAYTMKQLRGSVRPDYDQPGCWLWRVVEDPMRSMLATGRELTRVEAERVCLQAALAITKDWEEVDLAPAPDLYREVGCP